MRSGNWTLWIIWINKIRRYYYLPVVFFLFNSCQQEELIFSCGTYSPPECTEGKICQYTFTTGSDLTIIQHAEAGVDIGYKIGDGDDIVFHRKTEIKENPELPGGAICFSPYFDDLLFQIPLNSYSSLIKITPSEFGKYNVFYFYFDGEEYRYLKKDEGCIVIEKLNEDEWLVNVNLTYSSVFMGQKKSDAKFYKLQFTTTFKRSLS